MKASKLFTLAMVAIAMLSCTNEEPPASPDAGRSKLSILIKGETEAPKGRAAGNPTQTDESKVNNFIVFVFKANGNNDITPKEYTSLPSDNTVAELEITTDAKDIYVIANTQSNTAANDALKAVTSIGDLRAVVGRAFEGPSTSALPTQTSTNLWMVGKNDKAFTVSEGGNVTVAVTLKYVAAKVRITKVTVSDEKVADLSTQLTLTNVVVLNGGVATRFIPEDKKTTLMPSFTPATATPFYVSGVVMTKFTNKPTVVGRNAEFVYDLPEGDTQIGPSKNQHYFYLFENDGLGFDSQPTIVTLKGMNAEYDDVYYSVFFKMDNVDTPEGYDNKVIQPGKSYDITLTVKKMGTTDPTIPALKTTVDVTITPATWETVTIDKTFE